MERINPISIMILLEKFSEKNLISGLNILADRLDRDFCTLSYITKCIETYGKEGIYKIQSACIAVYIIVEDYRNTIECSFLYTTCYRA